MKKYLIAMLATVTVSLAGCGGMSQDQMMMMEEMSAQMSEIQFQVNSNAAAADRAKKMAQDAMVKASMMGGSMMMKDGSMMNMDDRSMMHDRNMKMHDRGMMHKQKMMK